MHSPWRITLFGGLSASLPASSENVAVHLDRFRTRRTAALLAYLAARLPDARPLLREQIAEAIWQDSEPEAARNRLKQEIASLRRQLEPPGIPPNFVLVATRLTLHLNPNAVHSDLGELRHALTLAKKAATPAERAALLSAPLAACAGDFLPGFYDEWVSDVQQEAEVTVADAQRILEEAGVNQRSGAGRRAGATPASRRPLAGVAPALSPPCALFLPLRLTRFFGRESELARLAQWLTEGRRLVTLTGAGGSGKTRLALEAAQAIGAQGGYAAVAFVLLADTFSASDIPGRIADALRLPTAPRIEDREALAAALNDPARFPGQVLLVLDNYEQLAAQEQGTIFVRELLAQTPRLTLLIASRQRLGIEGEREMSVTPLDAPQFAATPERLMDFPAVRLFLDRAQAVRSDFQITERNASVIAALIQRLEGVPLSLELAASWAHTLSPSRMVERFARTENIQRAGKSKERTRHDSLAKTLSGSLSLLTPQLRDFVTRLTVFRGGFTAEVAAEVCEEENAVLLLTQLRERSLLYSGEAGEFGQIRFYLLESLRELLNERLTDGVRIALQHRHRQWSQRILAEAQNGLSGPNQREALDSLILDDANLAAALEFCLQSDGWESEANAAEAGLQIAARRGLFYRRWGRVKDARQWITAALRRPHADKATPARAQALNNLANLDMLLGKYDKAVELYANALEIYRQINSDKGVADILGNLGYIHRLMGRLNASREFYEESVTIGRTIPGLRAHGNNLCGLGATTKELGDPVTALQYYEEALTIARDRGDLRTLGYTLSNRANIYNEQGDVAACIEELEAALNVFRQAGTVSGICHTLGSLVMILDGVQESAKAKLYLKECLEIVRQFDGENQLVQVIGEASFFAANQGDEYTAVVLFNAQAKRYLDAGIVMPEYIQNKTAKRLAMLRDSISETAFAAACSEGQRITWEAAIALAERLAQDTSAETRTLTTSTE